MVWMQTHTEAKQAFLQIHIIKYTEPWLSDMNNTTKLKLSIFYHLHKVPEHEIPSRNHYYDHSTVKLIIRREALVEILQAFHTCQPLFFISRNW